MKTFIIRLLTPIDAQILLTALLCVPINYNQYFMPFAFDKLTITSVLTKVKKDMYWGIFEKDSLAGFYMLRGFDTGYSVPTYGVWIAPNYSNLGLAQLTLAHAYCICKANQISKLMLKVNSENLIAKKLYEKLGFQRTSFDDKTGDLIYHKYFD